MRHRTFGSAGVQVPVVGQGTWQLEYGNADAAIEALRAGLDAGATHVDTAEAYGGGEVEELVAEAIRGRRDEVFLVSKVSPHHATEKGVVEACEASLSRLGTDHLDCYLLHWPGSHPLEETIAGFERLVKAGKIRSYGVSNFDVDLLRRAVEIAGPGRIACNQVLLNVKQRYAETRLLEVCREHDVALVAYSPFGKGDFPSPKSEGGQVLGEIAEAHGLSPYQVALAFLLRHPEVFAIPKASKPDHAKDNAAAGDAELTAEDIRRLEDVFPVTRTDLPTA